MALVSKSEASRLTGKSRATIHRHIKDGKLSEQDGQLDTSELIRVYGEFPAPKQSSSATGSDSASSVAMSQREAEQYTKQISQLERQVEDLRQDRDNWRNKTDELTDMLKTEQETTKLLTHQGGSTGNNYAWLQIVWIPIAIGALILASQIIER